MPVLLKVPVATIRHPNFQIFHCLFAILIVALVVLALSGCSQNTWKSLHVDKEARPVTLRWEANGPILKRIQFISKTVGWATGRDGTVWHTSNGGTSWELKVEDKNLSMVDLHFLTSGLRGWLVAETAAKVPQSAKEVLLFTTADGGREWELLYRTVEEHVNLIHFSSDTTGCIASVLAIRCTNNGGNTWSSRSSNVNSYWSGWYFLGNGKHGWAWAITFDRVRQADLRLPKRFVPRGTLIVATNDGGQTWVPTGQEIKANMLALSFLSDGQKGWALVNNQAERFTTPLTSGPATSKILYTVDSGVNWQPLAEDLSGGLKDLRFSSDGRNGWVIGSTSIASGVPLILHSSDGGRTWRPQDPNTDDQLIDLDFLPNGMDGWVLGKEGSMIRTRDGTKWEVLIKPSIDDFQSIQFTSDGQRGWALGSKGTILHTNDGGLHWFRQHSQAGVELFGLRMDFNGRRGWALGKGVPCNAQEIQLVSTEDGGREWKVSCIKADYTIFQAHLVSDNTAWVFGNSSPERFRRGPKHVLFTKDRGQSWREQHTFGYETLRAAYFMPDGPQGWLVTDEPTLFHTADNGQTWTDLRVESLQNTGYTIRALTFIADGQKGWAVGNVWPEKCLILHTMDGGRTWKRQDHGNIDGVLNAVYFLADGLRGWATGSEGNILYTSDGGANWQVQSKERGTIGDLKSAYFLNDQKGIRGWIVGTGGTILRSVGSKPHPVLGQYQVSSSTGGVELKWQLAEDALGPSLWNPEDLQWQIDYCSQKKCVGDAWQRILSWARLKPERSDGVATFTYSWDPADNGIGPGSQIQYRISIYDGRQRLAPQELGAHTYQPLWSRLAGWQRAGLIGAAAVLAYIVVCFCMLWRYPWAIFWIYEHLSIRDLIEPWAPTNLKAVLPTTFAFLPWFAKHQRVNQAWIKRYLVQPSRGFGDLSPSIRKHYVRREMSLDAWVAKHLTAAQDVFLRLPMVTQRSIHICMPIRMETEDNNTLIDQPQAEDFRSLMQAPRLLLTLIGIGGAGKSSLACQLARWSMSPLNEQRLAGYCMIPIVIEEDSTDLLSSIKERLTIIAGDDLSDDLLHNLLTQKRLLVVVESLSEKSREMQDHVSTIYGNFPVHALIITTRRPIHVLGATQVYVRPEEITVDRLAYFLLEYLRCSGRDNLFPRRKALELADRLLSIAESDGKDLPLTPLLVVLFVNQAIALAEQGEDLTLLPASIPETMIKYIKQLNFNKTLPDAQLIDSTLVVARQSLGGNYNPHDFERGRAVAALREKCLWNASYDILEELTDCGILKQRESAGTTFYRFRFDPVAEYMAALERIRTLGEDGTAWEQWLRILKNTEGYPKRMDGFVAALEVCVATYEKEFDLPPLRIREGQEESIVPSIP